MGRLFVWATPPRARWGPQQLYPPHTHTTQEALPELLKNRGVCINVSSVAGHMAYPANPAYGAAKAAQNMLTKSLALEYAPKGVRFLTVSPGAVQTPLLGACSPPCWEAAPHTSACTHGPARPGLMQSPLQLVWCWANRARTLPQQVQKRKLQRWRRGSQALEAPTPWAAWPNPQR